MEPWSGVADPGRPLTERGAVSDARQPTHVAVTAVGESMALLVAPPSQRLRHARSLELKVGGAESNVAIAVARLGLTSRWCSRVGDDELGRLVLGAVAAEGVDVGDVVVAEGERTGLYLRDRGTGGSRAHYYRDGSAASRLGPRGIDEAALRASDVLHVTGITPSLSPSAAAFVTWAIDCGREGGALISFDVNFRSKLWSADTARPVIEDLIGRADLVLVGDEEARALWGEPDPARLGARLGALGATEVVVKSGADGAGHWRDGTLTVAEGFVVDEVDPVGAGDAFAGGYLAGCAWGLWIEERLRVATAMGAIAVTGSGDYEALPDRDELQRFLDGTEKLGR